MSTDNKTTPVKEMLNDPHIVDYDPDIFIFQSDEFRYKAYRLKRLSNVFLKVAAMTNSTIAAVYSIVSVFI